MLDNALIKIFRPLMLSGLAMLGVEAEVKQNYQPTTQGVDSGPTLYFTKLFDMPVGWPQREEIWDADASDYSHRETQLIETTFQMTGVLRQTAEDTDGLTAADLASIGRKILQHDTTLAALVEAGVSVLRIGQIRNVQIVNGEDENEAVPSFDFVLKHADVTVTTTPAAVVKDFRVLNV